MFFFQFLNAFWNAGVKHESEKIWEIAAQVPLSSLTHTQAPFILVTFLFLLIHSSTSWGKAAMTWMSSSATNSSRTPEVWGFLCIFLEFFVYFSM